MRQIILVLSVLLSTVAAQDTGQETISEIGRIFCERYYRPAESPELVAAWVEGLRRQFEDPYIEYYCAADYKLLKQELSGKLQGIGATINIKQWNAEIRTEEKDAEVRLQIFKVASTIPGGPAEKAGVAAGDEILAIDGEKSEGKTLGELVAKLRGPTGSRVVLTVRRLDKVVDIAIMREEFVIPQLFYRLLTPEVGYVQVKAFSPTSNAQFCQMCREFTAQGVKGAILDLRSCTGGTLEDVLHVADALLDEGSVMKIERRAGVEEKKSEKGKLLDTPIVVLIDKTTKSGAELLAGALKDRGRGILIGSSTYGKGSVQEIFPLANGDAIKLTVAQYRTPGEQCVEKQGIAPHIEIASDKNEDAPLDMAIALIRALIGQKR